MNLTAPETLTEILNTLVQEAKAGIELTTLANIANGLISLHGATSINRGYQPDWAVAPFPSSVCLSVNDTVAHGIPNDYRLKDGDLLTIDCGILVDNVAADAGLTVGIGTISARDERLLRYTRRALYYGISEIKAGAPITAVGKAIEWYAKRNGFVVNKRLAGHGIGRQMHEEPTIPMYDVREELTEVPVFTEGQVVCIEPHLTYKDEFGTLGADGWTIRTRDNRKSAMAEHMVSVTTTGCEILTRHIPSEGEVT